MAEDNQDTMNSGPTDESRSSRWERFSFGKHQKMPEGMNQYFRDSFRDLASRREVFIGERQKEWEDAQAKLEEHKSKQRNWNDRQYAALEKKAKDAKAAMEAHEEQMRNMVWVEYMATISKVEPDLRKSGRAIATSLLGLWGLGGRPPKQDQPCSGHDGRPGKGQVPSWDACHDDKSPLKAMKPLVSPILDPFIDGMVEPLGDVLNQYKIRIIGVFVVSTAASFALGWLTGRLFGGGRGGSRSSSGKNSDND